MHFGERTFRLLARLQNDPITELYTEYKNYGTNYPTITLIAENKLLLRLYIRKGMNMLLYQKITRDPIQLLI